MSGFAAEWLALRDGADRRARNGTVLKAAVAAADRNNEVIVTDLGCGTGSNLRAMALHLPNMQRWRLVDNDPKLLEAARAALAHWADRSEGPADCLVLHKADKQIEVTFVKANLAKDFADVLAAPTDLVTAAAFFDLVSGEWITAFCHALARRDLPLYAVLTYDGFEQWSPPHPAEAACLAAFHAHQHRDKGFGPAAGPAAAAVLQAALKRENYDIVSGESPWRLGPGDRPLTGALLDGMMAAIAETGLVSVSDCASLQAVRAAATACTIGHVDIFARPNRPAD